MAGRPLRPATDRRLGGPLPHQLPNLTSAAPFARGSCESPAFIRRSYAVLAQLSLRYPPRSGTFRCFTHPFATRHQTEVRAAVRLACVRHAASVQSEPGSNSSVQSNKLANSLTVDFSTYYQCKCLNTLCSQSYCIKTPTPIGCPNC